MTATVEYATYQLTKLHHFSDGAKVTNKLTCIWFFPEYFESFSNNG